MLRQTALRQTTQPSLLARVRDPNDHVAWSEFDRRYGELIIRHCLGRGLQRADAEDVRQAVLMSMASALPGFRYSPVRGRFRSYLGRAVQNAVNRHLARRRNAPAPLAPADLAGAGPRAPADDRWHEQWVQHHLRVALRTVRRTFDARSVEVFEAYLAGSSTVAIAVEFGMSADAVQKVKERVRDRLRGLVAKQVDAEERMGGHDLAR